MPTCIVPESIASAQLTSRLFRHRSWYFILSYRLKQVLKRRGFN